MKGTLIHANWLVFPAKHPCVTASPVAENERQGNGDDQPYGENDGSSSGLATRPLYPRRDDAPARLYRRPGSPPES